MELQHYRNGNYVDIINRSGPVHLPMNKICLIGEVGLFHVKLYNSELPIAQQLVPENTNISDVSPIDLKEKHLLNFGFKKEIQKILYFNMGMHQYVKDDIYVYIIKDGFEIEIKTPAGMVNLWKTFKYIHHLQNIFIDIKGKELNFIK